MIDLIFEAGSDKDIFFESTVKPKNKPLEKVPDLIFQIHDKTQVF